jgi:hypothetical protein
MKAPFLGWVNNVKMNEWRGNGESEKMATSNCQNCIFNLIFFWDISFGHVLTWDKTYHEKGGHEEIISVP